MTSTFIANLGLALLLVSSTGIAVAYLIGRHWEQIKYERILKEAWQEQQNAVNNYANAAKAANLVAEKTEREMVAVSDVVDRILEDLNFPTWDEKTQIGVKVKDLADLAKLTEGYSSLALDDIFEITKKPQITAALPAKSVAQTWRCPCSKMHPFYETSCTTCSMTRPHAAAQ